MNCLLNRLSRRRSTKTQQSPYKDQFPTLHPINYNQHHVALWVIFTYSPRLLNWHWCNHLYRLKMWFRIPRDFLFEYNICRYNKHKPSANKADRPFFGGWGVGVGGLCCMFWRTNTESAWCWAYLMGCMFTFFHVNSWIAIDHCRFFSLKYLLHIILWYLQWPDIEDDTWSDIVFKISMLHFPLCHIYFLVAVTSIIRAIGQYYRCWWPFKKSSHR